MFILINTTVEAMPKMTNPSLMCMTPSEAYAKVSEKAAAEGKSMRSFCASRGVDHSTVSRWKTRKEGTVYLSILEKLLYDRPKLPVFVAQTAEPRKSGPRRKLIS